MMNNMKALSVKLFFATLFLLIWNASPFSLWESQDMEVAASTGTTYYVSNSAGNDNNSGTSSASPWKSLAKASTVSYGPGDQLLLMEGDVWNEMLTIQNSGGTPANPMLISSYGTTGVKPKIVRNSNSGEKGIYLKNVTGIKITNLEISHSNYGLFFEWKDSYNNEYVWVENSYFHDMPFSDVGSFPKPDGAITFYKITTATPPEGTTSVVKNVTVKNSQADHVRALTFMFDASPSVSLPSTWVNMIEGFYLEDCEAEYGWQYGTGVKFVTGGHIDNCKFLYNGIGRVKVGLAGIILEFNNQFEVRNTEIGYTQRGANHSFPDGVGIDYEKGNSYTDVVDSYIHHNASEGIMFFNGVQSSFNPGPNDHSDIMRNVFEYNNQNPHKAGPAEIRYSESNSNDYGVLKDNIYYYMPGIPLVSRQNTTTVTVERNTKIFGTQSMNYTRAFGQLENGFTGVTVSSSVEQSPWGKAKVHDGERHSTPISKGWTSNNSLNADHVEWIQLDMGSSRTINKVDLSPRDDGVHVGYGFPVDFAIETSVDGTSWTTQAVQSNVPKPGGTVQSYPIPATTARYVKITGTKLRPNPNDNNAYRMQLAEVEVYSPVVTASSSVDQHPWGDTKVHDGERNSTSSSQGWSSDNNVTQNHAEWIQLDMGHDRIINKVDLYPRNDGVHVGYGFPVDFTIEASHDGSTWTTVAVRTNVPHPNDAVQSIVFPASKARFLKITGTSLRPNPNDNGHYRMQFAEIEIYNSGETTYNAAKDWNFNTNGDFEGWSLKQQVSGAVSGGSMNITSSGNDPFLWSPSNLGIAQPSLHRVVRFRMKNGTSNMDGKVYFITATDTTWNESKSVPFRTLTNSDYTEYAVDMGENPNWTGTISRIRFDPVMDVGEIELDYIRITD